MTLFDPDNPEDQHPDLSDWPTADKTIEAIQAIATEQSARVIDGVLVDYWSAQAIVTVYNACRTDEQREALMRLDMANMGTFAWSCVR